jgi:signal transduction histidine kinase/uncharacterized protein YoaH (UPF0181 family)
MGTSAAPAESHKTDRIELSRLGEEQAALRRVATLVACGAASAAVFEAVTREVAQVLSLRNAAVCRYDDDGATMTVLAARGQRPRNFNAGSRFPLDGPSVSADVLRTGRAVRFEDYTDLPGAVAAAAREHGFSRVVGAPIIVGGRVWGVMVTSTTPDARLPDDLEARLAEFTELVATAIGNSQARDELARLAEEQAALRRVATLVAEGAVPNDVFEAVSAEVARLVPAEGAALTRFEDDGTVTALGGWTSSGGYVHAGRRFDLEGTVSGRVLEAQAPARMDDYTVEPGEAPSAAREMGWHSSVGAPITIDGRLWGVLAAVSTGKPMPPDTEGRLAGFAELVATAVANAESSEERARLTAEQAALRRVATLVADGASSTEVFDAVAKEVAQVLQFTNATVCRYDDEGAAMTVLALWGAQPPSFVVGSRWPLDGSSVAAEVLRTGRPARIEDYAGLPGALAAEVREYGARRVAGAPIIVDGRVWGLIATSGSADARLPENLEDRLGQFTELVATALANSQAHDALAELAEEQAALRRVATLVAEGAAPNEVFAAVRDEAARMLGVPLTVLLRYDDAEATVLATSVDEALGPVGTRWPLEGKGVSVLVHQTGKAARIDAKESGAMSQASHVAGIRSTVGVPIEVDGRLWGLMAAGSRELEPLPSNAEARLAKFTQLLATAIANAEHRAELDASRARILATADATRRKIERDLHDGAQQQLVSLALELRAAQATVPDRFDQHRSELSRVVEGLTSVLDDLREIALGIHPAGLSEGGLVPALGTLARRSPIPVELDIRVDVRLPDAAEVTAYYVVSEALTNVAKHAQASVVDVSVAAGEGVLRVGVRDDGRGGVDPAGGSGLVGLRDRIEAIGGTMRLTSPAGGGTHLRAVLPLQDD